MQWLRKASAIIAATSAATLLAACGGGSSSAGGGTLTVFLGAQPNFPTQFAAWSKDLTDKFKAKTGADLVIETYANAGDETTKIQSSIVSGTGPDIYNLGTTFTPVAYGTGGFQQLSDDDWKKIGGRERFIPESLGISGPDQTKQIGIPAAMRPFSLAYNTDMFKAAGIAAPPKTWDEFTADAKKLSNPGAGVYGTTMDYSDPYDPWKFIWAMTEQQGGSFVSADLKTAQLNSPEVQNATTAYFDMLVKDKLADPASVGWKGGDAIVAFGAGKAAMLPMATAQSVPTLDKSAVKGKYAFAPLPTVAPGQSQRPANGKPAASIVSGDNIAIASYTKDKDLALAFIDLFTSTDEQLANYKAFGNLPVNQDAMKQLSAQNTLLAPFLQIESQSTPTAFTGGWADVQNGVQNVVVQSQPGLAEGTYDVTTVKGLLDKANAAAQSALTRAQK
ncbi:MAG TPA: extracellular solute-binding protein [Pseudonocardia sp.]